MYLSYSETFRGDYNRYINSCLSKSLINKLQVFFKET